LLVSLDTARRIIFRYVRPLPTVRMPLLETAGLCLAEEVRADRDLPPADRSAMDGYAVRASDLQDVPRKLRLVGEVAAGSPARPRVSAGTCARIFTGANVPPGADAVVMMEETRRRGDLVEFMAPARPGQNIRRQGEEARRNDVLLRPGVLLGPAQIGLCASVGRARLRVHRRPRVGILVTGGEVRGVGDRVRRHELRDSNGPAIQASLLAAGFGPVATAIVPDDPRLLASAIRRSARNNDVTVVTGGVSVGEYDYVPEAMRRVGATIRFHGVRMKPGRPGLYATVRGSHVFGLPGNPLSVLTGLHEFVLPALRRLMGLHRSLCVPAIYVRLAERVRVKSKRTEFLPAHLMWGESGAVASPLPSHGSADLCCGALADGAIVVSGDANEVRAGSLLEFRPWRPLP